MIFENRENFCSVQKWWSSLIDMCSCDTGGKEEETKDNKAKGLYLTRNKIYTGGITHTTWEIENSVMKFSMRYCWKSISPFFIRIWSTKICWKVKFDISAVHHFYVGDCDQKYLPPTSLHRWKTYLLKTWMHKDQFLINTWKCFFKNFLITLMFDLFYDVGEIMIFSPGLKARAALSEER